MIEILFLNTVTGSSAVKRRTFESEGAYIQWLESVRGIVELVSVRAVSA